MKPSVKKLLNFLFIAAMLGLLLYLAFRNNELVDAWAVLGSVSFPWVLACLGCMMGYTLFDSLSMYSFLRHQKTPISFFHAIYVSITGLFYSNITPGSSGGQPMQIYELKKHDVPIGVSTSAISVKFFFNQLMVVVPTILLWIFNGDFVYNQLVVIQATDMRFIMIIGLIINTAAIPLILLLIINKPLVMRFCLWILRVGAKLRIVKNLEKSNANLIKMLDTFHSSIGAVLRAPWEIIRQGLCSTMQMLCLMAVALCVYHAFGLWEVHWYQLLTMAYMVFVSVSYTPLPGGSLAQEGGFMAYFAGMYPQGQTSLALLVWRFFTYYLILFVGIIVNLFNTIRGKGKKPSKDQVRASLRAEDEEEKRAV